MAVTKVWDGLQWATVGNLVYTNDRNLLPEFEVENGTGGFAPYGYFWKTGAPVCTVETNLANVYQGSKSQKVVMAAGELQRISSPVFAAQPGSVVDISYAAKGSVAGCRAGVALLSSGPSDPNPDFFASGTTSQEMNEFYPSTTDWSTTRTTFVVPSGDTKIRPFFNLLAPAGAAVTLWADAPSMRITEQVGVSGLRPVGEITMFLGSTIPTNWLECDGSTFSATDYPELNTLLGGTTLPDFRDRLPIGASGTKAANTTGGAATKTLATANVPSHTHVTRTWGHTGLAGTGGASLVRHTATGAALTYDIVSDTGTGSGTAFDVMNPWRAVKFIIRAKAG